MEQVKKVCQNNQSARKRRGTALGLRIWQIIDGILATKWCSHNWKQKICGSSIKYCGERNWHVAGVELQFLTKRHGLSRLSYLNGQDCPNPPPSTPWPAPPDSCLLGAFESNLQWPDVAARGRKTKTQQPSANPLKLIKFHGVPSNTTCGRHTLAQIQALFCLLTHTCEIFQARISLLQEHATAVFRCQCHDPSFGPAWGTLFCAAFHSSSSIIRCASFTEGAMAGDVAVGQLRLPPEPQNPAGFLRRFWGQKLDARTTRATATHCEDRKNNRPTHPFLAEV